MQAVFEGVCLKGLQMERSDLSDAALDGADLSGTNMAHSKLTQASMFGADLSDADLSAVDLSGPVAPSQCVGQVPFENVWRGGGQSQQRLPELTLNRETVTVTSQKHWSLPFGPVCDVCVSVGPDPFLRPGLVTDSAPNISECSEIQPNQSETGNSEYFRIFPNSNNFGLGARSDF